MPPTQRGLEPAYIQSARITDVDPVNWTMTARSAVGEMVFRDIPIPSLYLNRYAGEGVTVMPEVGADVWVCRPSEVDRRAFVVHYQPLADDLGTYRANRASMNPGDIFATTRDGNGIKIRRGGVVEVFASAICRTVYLPHDDSILNIAASLRTEVFGGSLRWEAALPEEDPDGQIGTQLVLEAKEFGDDPSPVVRVRLGGQIAVDQNPVVHVQVFKSGKVEKGSLQETLSCRMTKGGELYVDSGTVRIHLAEGATFEVYNTALNAQGVMLGRPFLTTLNTFLIGLQTALGALGLTVPGLINLITETTTSITAQGAPYISTRTKSE